MMNSLQLVLIQDSVEFDKVATKPALAHILFIERDLSPCVS